MKYSGSLDSNALLRLIVGDVPSQATKVTKLIEEGKLFMVADVAIIEVIFVLERYYQYTREQIAEAIQFAIEHPKISTNTQVFYDVLKLFKSHPALSPEDCYLATKASANKATPLWTFDKKLIKQAGGVAQEIKL